MHSLLQTSVPLSHTDDFLFRLNLSMVYVEPSTLDSSNAIPSDGGRKSKIGMVIKIDLLALYQLIY